MIQDARLVKSIIFIFLAVAACLPWTAVAEAEPVLLDDLASGDRERKNYAAYTLMRLGSESYIPALIEALDEDGNSRLATTYINSGRSDLAQAGYRWAARHNYRVEPYGGGGSQKWGGN